MEIPFEILKLFMIERVLSVEILVKRSNITIYYVQSDTGEYIFKSVHGQEKVKRLFDEVGIFQALAVTSFDKYAKPLISINKENIEADFEVPGLYWCAMQYIPNKQNMLKDFVAGVELGRSVAELHSLPLDIDLRKPSRVNEVKYNIDFLVNQGYKDLLYDQNFMSSMNRISEFPRSFIHGDLNFGNIIWNDMSKFMFIDFEFSRYDLRILDIATLLSLQINKDNQIEVVPIEFKNGFLSGYNEIIQITQDELDHLESASIIYWLLVLMDTNKSNGMSINMIHNILKILIEGLS